MKKFAVLLLSLVAFVSCNQTPAASPFAGTWAGTFSVVQGGQTVPVAGTLSVTVSSTGTLTGTVVNNTGEVPDNGSIKDGTVSSQGAFTATYTYASSPNSVLGLTGTVKIEGDKLVGTNLNNTFGTEALGTVSFSLTKK